MFKSKIKKSNNNKMTNNESICCFKNKKNIYIYIYNKTNKTNKQELCLIAKMKT